MSRAGALSAALALASLTCPAFADDAPAPPPLVAPAAVSAGSVSYPDGATDAAVVVVELLVSDAGWVRDARVTDGKEPFAGATLTAAYGWRFTPARRGDTAVAARIRMRVEFHPPEVAPPPASVESSSTTPTKPTAPSGVEDVLVRGRRVEAGETRLGSGEVRQIPGAFGDAFRAIEALPGVTPIVSGLPFFFVRGAPPGNTGTFVDGVRVPLLYHLALGPSVIHPALIDSVEFYPGGFPAQYGRYAGGILDGVTRGPARKLHGEANVRLFDAGALVEAPLLDGKLTALISGRYSYTAALVQLFAKDTQVAYWDYQARLSYALGKQDRLSVFAFGSFDEIDTRTPTSVLSPFPNEKTTETVGRFYPLFRTEFHRVDLRWDHETRGGHLRVAATVGADDSIAGDSETHSTQAIDTLFSLRATGDQRASPSVTARYGADVVLSRYSLVDSGTGSSSGGRSLYPNRDDVMLGAYADVVWKASERVEVVPGLRLDVFTSRLAPGQQAGTLDSAALQNASGQLGVDPRVATRVRLSNRVTWLTTFGVSHQPPSLTVPVPGLELGRLNTGLQTSLQTSQGLSVTLPFEITATATAFLHHTLGLTDATATCLGVDGTPSGDVGTSSCLDRRVRGRSFGVELLVRRDLTKRLTGWVSYTLSRSTRQTQGVVGATALGAISPPGLVDIPSEFDRTHVLNVIGAYDLGAGWRAGARFVFYTGRPYTQTVSVPGLASLPLPPYNSERLPAFYRVDVRLEKRWHVGEAGSIALVLEGMNVTLSKEAIGVTCTPTPGSYVDTCTPTTIGPVSVPSLGVEGAL